jgi:uncharacterized protein DUF4239
VHVLLGSLVIVGGSVLMAHAGLIFVRRKVPLATLREHHDVAGFLIGVLGMAYTVLLAFMVLTVWTQFEEAKVTAAQEANALTGIFRTSQGFAAPTRHRLLTLTRDYAQAVVDREWPAMDHGGESRKAGDLLDGLWQAIREVEPRTAREQALYSEVVTRVNAVSDERRLRLLECRDGVPSLMWAVLISGALLTVGFTFLFGVKNFRAQAIMTAALVGTIALNLFLVATLDYPFSGDLRVTPEAFQEVLAVYDRLESQPLALH